VSVTRLLLLTARKPPAWGYEPVLTSTVDESLAALAHDDFVFSLLDVSLNGVDGTELLRRLKIQ
jgi:DNA-binding response OmpR family regulator